LKQSGLRRSVPYSATQNLAYLPCRIESHVSIFRFLVGEIVSKKTSARETPRLSSPHQIISKFAATCQTSYQGAFPCCLKAITKLQMCFGLTLAPHRRRHYNEDRADFIVLRPEVDRRSNLVLRCEPIQERCAGNSSCPAAARRAAFFRPNGAVTASARITAASPSSPVVFSPSNPRFCFWTKPDSACRTPSPTMGASGIGIG